MPPSHPRSDDFAEPSFLEGAVAAAQLGGQQLLHWLGEVSVRSKGPRDLVTEADFASQQAIAGELLRRFPDHQFLGEEQAGTGNLSPAEALQAEYCWIVDPLDGTTNFVHQLPSFSVSVALFRRGQPLVGVVWDPVLQELYSAQRNQGARLGDRSLSTSGCQDLARSLQVVSLERGARRGDRQLDQFLNLLEDAGSLRRLGSAALNLCYVASGRIDAYWAARLQLWDVAAGLLIAQEAGAVASDLDGNPVDWQDPRFVCAATDALRQATCRCLNR